MTSQPGQEIVVIHILPKISRSKGNQTMVVAHLIEYKMSNFFLEKSYTKCGGDISPRTFPETEHIFGSIV